MIDLRDAILEFTDATFNPTSVRDALSVDDCAITAPSSLDQASPAECGIGCESVVIDRNEVCEETK